MAWVIIGGLLTSTIFTLIIIPIIFVWFQSIMLGKNNASTTMVRLKNGLQQDE
jgi:hypothetical protein